MTGSRRRFSSHLATAAIAALSIAALAGCGDSDDGGTTEAEFPGFEITGNWSGTLEQEGLQPFRVVARIEGLEDTSRKRVRYSGAIECGGRWTYLGREGTAYRFREVIDRGAGQSCKGTGTVTLTPFAADAVDYEFRGGGVESFGVLNRRGG